MPTITSSKPQVIQNGDKGLPVTKDGPVHPFKNGHSTGKRTKAELMEHRKSRIGKASKLFFAEDPLLVKQGQGQYLIDEDGRKYLDCISNVQHVGHAHPAIAEAAYQQMLKTNCNIRFLNETVLQYTDVLKETLPPELTAFFFCNSGSEANDLAYRMCLEYTEGTEFIVLDGAYHGHTSSMVGLSPYKFKGAGGQAHGVANPHVHVVSCPDVYRGPHRLADAELNDPVQIERAGKLYANEVKDLISHLTEKGLKLAGFFMEAFQSCGGQIITPPGYLRDVIKYVHEAGGLVVVDEVQTGFGRVGSHFWAFQTQTDGSYDLVPDILTMGKPMGNGFPVACAVTTDPVNQVFGHLGMEYFNTYGGNPVSAAVCLAVMRVIREERLQEQAAEVGAYFLDGLRTLQTKHPHWIGDVRGVGMFIGVELVENRAAREPMHRERISTILRRMKDRDIIINSEGPDNNVIKMKPPICFTKENVDSVCANLDAVLTELRGEEARVNGKPT